MKNIYVVLSQTGSFPSRVLRFFTHDEYNHVSISLTPTLDKMYSFGRLNASKPFPGGFVEEGKNKGTFQRFSDVKAMVIELAVTDEKYNCIKYFIEYFLEHKQEFKYNYLGILFALFKKNHESGKRYYCSQFVRACLALFDIENAVELPKMIKPIDFLKLNNKNIIFEGLLKNYFTC